LPRQTSLAEEAADARTRENRLLDYNTMNVYVFGNERVAEDIRAIEVARELQNTVEDVSFVFVNPNEDVPFANEPRVVILDTIQGLRDVALVEGDELDGLLLSPRGSYGIRL
jgi:hypothetical protein